MVSKKILLEGLKIIKAAEIPGYKEFDKHKIKIWQDLLSDLTDNKYMEAINRCARECKFFPSIAEIREKAGGNQDRALLAWLKAEKAAYAHGMYQSVKFPNAIIHSVIQAMGGWEAFNQITESELTWKKREFIELYNNLKGKEDHPDHLVGFIERENMGRFELDPVVQIGQEVKRALLEPEEDDGGERVSKDKVAGLCNGIGDIK